MQGIIEVQNSFGAGFRNLCADPESYLMMNADGKWINGKCEGTTGNPKKNPNGGAFMAMNGLRTDDVLEDFLTKNKGKVALQLSGDPMRPWISYITVWCAGNPEELCVPKGAEIRDNKLVMIRKATSVANPQMMLAELFAKPEFFEKL